MSNTQVLAAAETMRQVIEELQASRSQLKEKDAVLEEYKKKIEELSFKLHHNEQALMVSQNEYNALSLEYSEVTRENRRLKGSAEAKSFIRGALDTEYMKPKERSRSRSHSRSRRSRRSRSRSRSRRSRSRRSRSHSRTSKPVPNRFRFEERCLKTKLYSGYISPALVGARVSTFKREKKRPHDENSIDIRHKEKICRGGCRFLLCRCKNVCTINMRYSVMSSLAYAVDAASEVAKNGEKITAVTLGVMPNGKFGLQVGDDLYNVQSYSPAN